MAENANLKVSRLESGLSGVEIFDQRHAVLAKGARADFSAAELGGENIYVHSYGLLAGDHSAMTEKQSMPARRNSIWISSTTSIMWERKPMRKST